MAKAGNTGSRRAKAKAVAPVREAPEREAPKGREAKYAKGFFVGLGIVAGTGFGVPYGFATANPNVIWAGLVIGTALGAAYEQRYNKSLSSLAR